MKILITFIGLFVSPFLFSQILTINAGSSVSIASGSSITLDGLEIAPDDTYVIRGANDVSRTATAVTAGDNSSVSRVYNTNALLTDFTGNLTFSYLDGELNNITESELVLELQADDDSWTSYTGTRDETNNTVSYTFNDPVSFKAVTASAAGATLTIEDINPAGSSILVYPNPTADRIYIQADTNSKAELFDLMGRKVRSTNQSQMDMSTLSSGNYILQVKTQNKTQSFKIIKQ
ncbi:MAG: T9SS type A sorting domain-containing protein [Flavobacteriaceae bacterium]|nr:T9SS type A sorting domain-containing protein [Flavobacteriaceae bacterium]MDG2314268.1 T9SS type A sorting domain-containing protein [Flavobacteriaceae bacterium]